MPSPKAGTEPHDRRETPVNTLSLASSRFAASQVSTNHSVFDQFRCDTAASPNCAMCPLHWPLIAFALGRLYGRWSHSIQFVPLGGDATILEATSTVGLAVRTIRIGKIPVNAWNVQSMASADGDVAASLAGVTTSAPAQTVRPPSRRRRRARTAFLRRTVARSAGDRAANLGNRARQGPKCREGRPC
jgi:hypothetical protein